MTADEMMGIVARAMHELGHRSAHATVGTGEMVQCALARPQPQPEMTVGSGCSRPYELTPTTAKSPEGTPQKCAAGRDAGQIAEHKEVGSCRWLSFLPFRNHASFCGGANAEGPTPHV